MRSFTARLGLLVGAAGLGASALVVPPVSATPDTAGPPEATTIELSGILTAAVSEPDGRVHHLLERPDGSTLGLRMDDRTRPATPSRWRGRVLVPDAVVDRVGTHVQDRNLRSDSRTGREVVRELLRHDADLRTTGTAANDPLTPASTPATHRWFVVTPTMHGAQASNSTAHALATEVAQYWRGQANGRISTITMQPQVMGYTSTVTDTDCGLAGTSYWDVRAEAIARTGADVLAGDQIVLIAPNSCQFTGASGRGDLGASVASGGFSITLDNPDWSLSTLAHEVGHNYGLMHAGLYSCGGVTPDCLVEYGGIYNVMAVAISGLPTLTALSTAYRVRAGLTDPGEVATPDFSAAFQETLTIRPRSDSAGLRGIHVLDPDSGEPLLLDHRSGTGQDVGSAYARPGGLTPSFSPVHFAPGVVIEHSPATGHARTSVVPGSPGEAALSTGQTWSNGSGSLTISAGAITPAGAEVTVTYAPTGTDPGPGTVRITGNPVVDGSLVAESAGWGRGPLEHAWFRDGVEIQSARGSDAYFPSFEDGGTQITVRVTGWFEGGWHHAVTSAPVSIPRSTFQIHQHPTVFGSPTVGSEVLAFSGSWGIAHSPVHVEWQWQANGAPIPDALQDDSFTLTAAQLGTKVRVCQSLTATGYEPTSICSAELGPVTENQVEPEGSPIDPAPRPRIVGIAQVGVPLTAVVGTWDPQATLTTQWLVGRAEVPGATGTTYVPRPTDVGRRLGFRVLATKPGEDSVQFTARTTAVAPGTLTSTIPKISGKAKVQKLLKVSVRGWTSGTRLSYQWFANAHAIPRATKAQFKLSKKMRGKKITVRVTGHKAGYVVAVRTSRPTRKVRR